MAGAEQPRVGGKGIRNGGTPEIPEVRTQCPGLSKASRRPVSDSRVPKAAQREVGRWGSLGRPALDANSCNPVKGDKAVTQCGRVWVSLQLWRRREGGVAAALPLLLGHPGRVSAGGLRRRGGGLAQPPAPAHGRRGRLLRRVHVPRVLLLVQGTAPGGARGPRGVGRLPAYPPRRACCFILGLSPFSSRHPTPVTSDFILSSAHP